MRRDKTSLRRLQLGFEALTTTNRCACLALAIRLFGVSRQDRRHIGRRAMTHKFRTLEDAMLDHLPSF
jgi:hypothetical protein